MFVLIRKAYERARLYTQRFHQIRENFEIDNSTDPTVLNTERGIYQNMIFKILYINPVLFRSSDTASILR